MTLSDHPKAYGTAAVAAAFVAGVLVTLGFKDLYPDLERKYQRDDENGIARGRRQPWAGTNEGNEQRQEAEATNKRRTSLFFGLPSWNQPVRLQDHEKDAASMAQPATCFLPDAKDGIEECIGSTPLVKIRSLSEATGCTILAKAEFLNGAGGSPKDRVALNMIRQAEAQGLLVPGRGDTIYEGTVGSTGISLAMLARARGYKAHICMPDDQSHEKSDLLHHLGATVERVPVAPIADPAHFVNLARRRAEDHSTSSRDGSKGFYAGQFESLANYQAHIKTTGPEIVRQTGGKIDAFVAGAGTGGTISGVAIYLKEEAGLRDVRVVLADPQGSGLFNKIKHGVMYSSSEREGTRRRQQVDSIVEGIGLKWLTSNFEAGRELIDDAVRVTDEQACRMARWLVERDGIFVGSSSAVNCVAAVMVARRMPKGSQVVTVLCDSGSRHLSRFWKQIAVMGLEDAERRSEANENRGDASDIRPEPSDLLAWLDMPPQNKVASQQTR